MDVKTVRAAVEQCKAYGAEITVENVWRNVALKPGDFNELIERGGRQDTRLALKRAGIFTNDAQRNTKVEPEKAKLSDLEALLKIKERNEARVHAQTKALRQLVEFLRIKKVELGYDPYLYLFQEDAERIYAMHGVALPSNWGKM